MLPSKFEGLGLPMIEAMMAGSIPITCSDNPTALELSPPEFICEPTESDFLNKILELNEKLESNPELVNSDPYVDGWMVKIKFSNAAEINNLLSHEDYTSLVH